MLDFSYCPRYSLVNVSFMSRAKSRIFRLFLLCKQEIDYYDDEQENSADKSESDVAAVEERFVVKTVVEQACQVVNGAEDGQTGEERNESVRFLFRFVPSCFNLLADHFVELVVVALGVETLFHLGVDNVRQEIIRDGGIAVFLLKLVQALLQNDHIFRPSAVT